MKKSLVLFLAVGSMALATAVINPTDAVAGTEAGAGLKVASADQSYLAGIRMEGIRQNYLGWLRMEAIRAGEPKAGRAVGIASTWLTMVGTDTVNMVTNSVDESAVNSVKIDGRAYNVNGEMGASAMRKNPSIRFSRDPLTNNKVDKSTATICEDASGRVYYFESPSTYREFLSLGDREAVYAFSKTE